MEGVERRARTGNERTVNVYRGVKPLTVHGLRHTHATLLLSAGRNPLEVSERLGHNSVAFTLDRYGHVIPSDASEVARAGEAAIGEHDRWVASHG